ncbi:MAG: N-acetyl-1-D-myo-inositol-2-amino-2-deoxy-alpha-D-glucopyranoside deacetylase [Gordonia sp.]|uniref:1D-myo-inositol 2-acetamido-2-deoxy-alpha-D-glucopyranoside deacetylase n=1 Tax=Gordonia rubripertincta TaxID=36822 RepID=A0ABT4MNX3_GORRU|nr:N-acetyl-1-D-myo-inositol-2-amino-2-deoxy-alpha-D-glucopyranoside deacetylase [Gordonia rubripertincta]MBA4025275.1 N-acetyl-1-D-myo-inositol-2-amino-2-deoxy-alpha-D-glucopyranoside deacetylase [Gordonia sp. (in: high G+C Gram-positive bacteria)]MCZ4548699.1 N-acetyl-1-D-myo-inositol-2-amino-2-deoxy-alpha-D-glucopyranoside deacetylase [Gordonia rubripertincta]
MNRLLLVHAHPDDETITTGGTIAKYLAAGAEVTVVTCTLGEEGEVIGARWGGLVADGGADQLGGYRIGELTEALVALSPDPATPLEPHFLGGAGRWRDSGMAGAPSNDHPRAFIGAGSRAPAEVLAELIVELRPQVLVGYDPVGSYGHPDHIQVHAICAEAIDIAAAADNAWTVSKHYWTVTEESALSDGLASAQTRVPAGWRMPAIGELPSHRDGEITTAIDVREVYDRKVRALAAHATQVTVAPSGTEYALSNNIIQPIFAEEHYMLVAGAPGPLGPVGRETDLFGGL